MTWLEWTLGFMLLSFYITCLFTVCSMTFQKGYTVLGIVGIFLPWLWLIGAFLPAKKGSRYELAQQIAYQRSGGAVLAMRRWPRDASGTASRRYSGLTEGRMRMNALRCTGERVAMPTMRTASVAHAGATGRLAGIRAEMAVEDASGGRDGRVIFVQVGAATDGGSGPSNGGTPRTELSADLAERLRRNGDITIADTRYFRRDVRSSATPDQVLSVEASVVRLNRRCRDRITACD